MQLTIDATAGTPWQVSLPDTWVSTASPLTGTGSATVPLTVSPWIGTASRQSTLSVNQTPVRITQTALASMAAVTIDSVPSGAEVYVDFEKVTTPYTTQWQVGSTHHLIADAWKKVNGSTVRKFEGWPSAGNAAEQFFVTPANPSTLTASFINYYALKSAVLNGSPSSASIVPSYRGAEIPASVLDSLDDSHTIHGVYREGSTLHMFANSSEFRFLRFTAPIVSTQNPIALNVTSPLQVEAEFDTSAPTPNGLFIATLPSWRFYGAPHAVNPIATPLYIAQDPDTPHTVTPFIRYDHYALTEPAWLTLRNSGSGAPGVLEYGIDPSKVPAGATAGDATVFLYNPDLSTRAVTASYDIVGVPTGPVPTIAAITDGGGFRQLTAIGNYNLALGASPGMILTLFGERLASTTMPAPSTPLPTSLSGTRVEVWSPSTDAWVPAPLFFISPGQINCQVPDLPFSGDSLATNLRIVTANGESETRPLLLRRAAASMFTANSSGLGAAAGFSILVKPGDVQIHDELHTCGIGTCGVKPIPLGGNDDKLFLELYGTGFSNVSKDNVRVFLGTQQARVDYVGPHGVFVGLTQLNVEVPRDVVRNTDLDLYVWVRQSADSNWQVANRMTIRFQ